MKNKHIRKYSEFLFEQDMMSAMPGAPVVTPKKQLYHFIFVSGMDDEGVNRRKYPDGSTIIEYPCYSLELPDLASWIEKNIITTSKKEINPSELDIRKKNLVNIVKGDKLNISDEDLPFIDKLKNSVSADMLGRREPDVTVVYSTDGVPTTEEINVTFIKYKK
jgi:hypothetical protein